VLTAQELRRRRATGVRELWCRLLGEKYVPSRDVTRKNEGIMRKLLAGVTATALAVTAASCGSSAKTSSGGTPTTATTAAPKGATEGKAAPPKFTVGYVDIAATIGSEPQIYGAFKAGANALGWTVKLADAQLDPTKALQATELFVNDHVNAIVFSSVPGQAVFAGIKEAKAAGIPTIELSTPYASSYYSAEYTFKFTESALSPLIDAMKKDLKPGAKVGDVWQSQVEQYETIHQSVLAALKAAGFDVVGVADIPETGGVDTNWQKGVAAIAEANPGITGVFDEVGFVTDDLTGLASAHDSGIDVFATGVTNLSVPALVKPDSPLKVLVEEDFPQLALKAVDDLLAYAADKTPLPGATSSDATVYTAATLPDYLKKTPGSDAYPIPTAQLLQPYLTEWSKTYSLPINP
jgi:ABC-type sugar transport system substrate-binding protein